MENLKHCIKIHFSVEHHPEIKLLSIAQVKDSHYLQRKTCIWPSYDIVFYVLKMISVNITATRNSFSNKL